MDTTYNRKLELRRKIKEQKALIEGTWPNNGEDIAPGDTEGMELMHVQISYLDALLIQFWDMLEKEIVEYTFKNYYSLDEWDTYHCYFCGATSKDYPNPTFNHGPDCLYQQAKDSGMVEEYE